MQHEESIFIVPPRANENIQKSRSSLYGGSKFGPYDHCRIEACGLSRSVTLDLQRPNEYEWPVIVWNVYHEIQLV